MALVVIIDLIAIIALLSLARSKQGLENSLPFAAFLIVLVPIDAGFFTITIHRVIIGVLVLLYLTSAGRADREARRLPAPLKALLIVNVCWYLVAAANSLDVMTSIKKAVSVILEYYAVYFIYVKTISSVKTINRIIVAIVLAIVVCCLFGVSEAYQGWTILSYFPAAAHHWEDTAPDRDMRIQSTYPHAILYGAALAMAIILAFYLLTVVSTTVKKIALWTGLALMFLNLYKTGSRGPWIDTILGCLLLLLFSKGQVRRAISYVAVISVLVLVLRPGVWLTIKSIYINTFDTETSTGTSYAYRQALLDAAVRRLSGGPVSRLLWGYGPESFYSVRLEGELAHKPHVFLSCDNSWVQFLIETGAVGLAIMLIMLMNPAWAAWRQFMRLPKPSRYLSLTLLIVFAIWYLQMYSVSMYSWGQTGYTLWILIALTYSYRRIANRQSAPPEASRKSLGKAAASAVQNSIWFGNESEAQDNWHWGTVDNAGDLFTKRRG